MAMHLIFYTPTQSTGFRRSPKLSRIWVIATAERERTLRTLPQWFGIESAIVVITGATERMRQRIADGQHSLRETAQY